MRFLEANIVKRLIWAFDEYSSFNKFEDFAL